MQYRSGAVHCDAQRSLGTTVLDYFDRRIGGAELTEVLWYGEHSTGIFELRFADGRSLMVKRADHDWARARFEASARAATLLREETEILAPRPICVPADLDDRPLQAYWRIEHPTVAEVWADLTAEERQSAMCTLGELLEQLHGVQVDGWGPLAEEQGTAALSAFLESDLGDRLLPAARGMWPGAVPQLEDLFERIPELLDHIGPRAPTLAHNDIHMGNVLCQVDREAGTGVRCIGLLDLDSAAAMPAESDAASFDVLHGPHFANQLPRAWKDRVWSGYPQALDPWAVVFFRALHLANVGIYSALLEHHEHAEHVAELLALEMDRLSGGEHSHLGALGCAAKS